MPTQPGDFSYADRLRVMLTQLLPRMAGVRLRNGDWTFGARTGRCHADRARCSVSPVCRAFVARLATDTSAHRARARQRARHSGFFDVVVHRRRSICGVVRARSGDRAREHDQQSRAGPPSRGPRCRGRWTRVLDDGRPDVAGGYSRRLLRTLTSTISSPRSTTVDTDAALGDYWSAHRLDYLADGKVHASAEPPYVVRLPELYESIVSAPGRYVRVAPIGSDVDRGTERRLARRGPARRSAGRRSLCRRRKGESSTDLCVDRLSAVSCAPGHVVDGTRLGWWVVASALSTRSCAGCVVK